MRKIAGFLSILILGLNVCWSQQAPQTARQALMEMVFSKEKGTFIKHLPQATRAALDKSGALTTLQQYSAMTTGMQAQGNKIQTFESGPVLFTGEDPKTGQKFDITVESDKQHGEFDDITLSGRTYKDGQVQRTPFMPQVTFSMKKEADLWTLNEVSVTLHLPLADPDLLKALTEKMKPQPGPQITIVPHTATIQPAVSQSVMDETHRTFAGSDEMVLDAMRTILNAEATYATRYPQTGYACTLSDLDGFGSSEANEHQAMLINSGLASGKKYGFVFTISNCAGSPVTRFHLTASTGSFGRKAFCADQGGVIRSSEDGKPDSCLAHGMPVQ
jgi:hypothetical protein